MGIRNFFSSLVPKKKDPREKHAPIEVVQNNEKPDFEALSVDEIISFLQGYTKNRKVGVLAECFRRLLEVAFKDRNISDEDQRRAILLSEEIRETIEEAFANNTEALAAFKKAVKFSYEEDIKYFGRGSLAWELSTPGLTDYEIFSVILDPRNCHLLSDYISKFSDSWNTDLKPGAIKRLIRERRRRNESNAVLIAAGLITGSDEVAWNIFTPTERDNLANVALNYAAARQVLEKYKLLPETSNALPFGPTVDKDLIAGIALTSINDQEDPPWSDTALSTHPKFKQIYQHESIGTVLVGLRILVWLETLESLYGKEFANSVECFIASGLTSSWSLGLSEVVATIRSLKHESLKNDGNLGWDTMIAIHFMDGYLPEDVDLTEEAKIDLVRSAATIFNEERVFWLAKSRFFIRFFVNKVDERREEFHLSDNEHEIYEWLGSMAGNLEARSFYEDWIGTKD